MPLMRKKSKQAFEHNVKAEMDSGKPQDQALAIAYSIQKKNKKKMANGGMVEMNKEAAERDMGKHDESIADAIMRKKKGSLLEGQVDLSRNADEDPNFEDQQSFEALRKENYSESEALEEVHNPEDSTLHDVELSDEDMYDMVDMIRKKMRMKKGE